MPAKKVAFGARPQPKEIAPTAEEWVEQRHAPSDEETTRYTIDISVSLHRRMKAQCAMRGVKMSAVIREILEKEFPA